MATEMKATTPLANVLRASMRAEHNPLCKAFDIVLGQCDLQAVEQCIRTACETFNASTVDALALKLEDVMRKQFSSSANPSEQVAAHLVRGMLASDIYEMSAVLEDIVYPMYLDPEDIRASVLE